MTEQALDFRTFLRTVRQYKAVAIITVVVGALAGVGYTVVDPPLPTSNALVLLPQSVTRFVQTQVVIATSEPVLRTALPQIRPRETMDALRIHIKATEMTSAIISISAKGETGAQAKSAANAVAESFVDYIGSKNSAFGRQTAELIPATLATKGSLLIQMLFTGAAGLLAGMIIGAIIAVWVGRNRRRLHQRDELAVAVNAPVLASIAVHHPSDAAGWLRLFEDYEPSSADEIALRRILRRSGAEVLSGRSGADGGRTLMVVSLHSDDRALAVGPQLAAFAASRGVPTALVMGPQQDEKATANLRTACESRPDSLPRRTRPLELVVTRDVDSYWIPEEVLAVVVCVVNGNAPRMADLMPATATFLAVSAGAARSEQLAKIAIRSAASGHRIDGVIVTNPDPGDVTTGYVPRPVGPPSRIQPTRVTG
jgi:capsular polysaccharide biosynthesis protein